MIVLGAVLPHPPILLPQIGKGRQAEAQSTLDAYDTVAARLGELAVQRLLIISTHGIVTLQRYHILASKLSGDLERFQANLLTFEREADSDLVTAIQSAADTYNVPLTPTNHWEQSDHSVGVPLRLLGDSVPAQIAVVSISFRPPQDHYNFGRAIADALATFSEPTAIIASGDAVHTLTEDSSYGLHPRATEVQQQYETALATWDYQGLIAIDESLRREVDESVISPTLILMGALQGQSANPRILASEHPWGVAYVTALVQTQPDPAHSLAEGAAENPTFLPPAGGDAESRGGR